MIVDNKCARDWQRWRGSDKQCELKKVKKSFIVSVCGEEIRKKNRVDEGKKNRCLIKR